MFCEHLFKNNKNIELQWKVHEEWGNQLKINPLRDGDSFLDHLARSMTEVFISHRLGNLIRYIIKKNYYFSNHDEIDRIHDLSNWIFSGTDAESIHVRKGVNPKHILHSLFHNHIKMRETIHYDSIVKFGLKAFKDEMIHYVGLAIDEYKREEEHQEFIHALRNYISKKQPSLQVVHVIQGKTFTFYQENGKLLSKLELKKIMDQEPLYLFGLDGGNEMNLAPLIAMAPRRIKIYGDDLSEPKTQTVMNIFQEKVEFESIRKFPFQHMKKEQ